MHGVIKRGYERTLKRGTKTCIKKRDGNKCVLCDTTANLCVHHFYDDNCNPVLPPSEGLTIQNPYTNTRDIDLVTLCDSCHGKIHANPKSQIGILLQEIMKDNYKIESCDHLMSVVEPDHSWACEKCGMKITIAWDRILENEAMESRKIKLKGGTPTDI